MATHCAYANTIADLNSDGYLDIVFSNGYNGSTYDIDSYIYWGSASGFSNDNKTELATHSADANTIADLNSDGYLDILFSNHHTGDWIYNTDSYIYWGSASGFSNDSKTGLATNGVSSNAVADLNNDGYLDIVFANSRKESIINNDSCIYWGSISGFSNDSKTELDGSRGNAIADLNSDGYLDIVVSNTYHDNWRDNINAYIYWGSVSGFSNDSKTELSVQGVGSNFIADLNADGYLDIILMIYNDGSTFNANSYIYWGSASGFDSADVPTEIQTHGVYHGTTADMGNIYNRGRELVYTSNAYDTGRPSAFVSISWIANTPSSTAVEFQVRTAETEAELASAEWYGPTSTEDRYTESGTMINPVHNGDGWVQYRAYLLLSDPIGIATPSLEEVFLEIGIIAEIDIKPGSEQNIINLGSKGVIPVVILSSPDFDATQVDPTTVELAGAGVAIRGKGNTLAHQEDANADDLTDLVVQIETENLDPDQIQNGEAILTGETYDGQAIGGRCEIIIVPPQEAAPAKPAKFALYQNYPNSFNPDTWIPYQLAEDVDVDIGIYDAAGRLVRALNLGHKPAGFYTTKDKAAHWDAKNEAGEPAASGIYFYTIQAGTDFTATKKMVIAK